MTNNISTIILISIIIIISLTSCSSKSVDKLEWKKKEIQTYFDSANFYMDKILADSKNGIPKDKIRNSYGRKLKKFQAKINQALKDANTIGNEMKISNKDYENWMNSFDTKALKEKNSELIIAGIDLSKLPETNNYQLSQKYIDDKNSFTIQIPQDWQAFPNYQGQTLMTAGAITDSTKTDMKRAGGFGVSITDLNKEYSNETFYYRNLDPIKKEYKDFDIIEEYDIDINGIPAKYISYSVTVKSKLVTSIQVYFCKGLKGYILNGTALGDSFETYRDLYIQIARTFTLRDN